MLAANLGSTTTRQLDRLKYPGGACPGPCRFEIVQGKHMGMMTPDPAVVSNRRVALVTGSSRGIGRAIAIELAGIGYDLMINYLSNEAAAEQVCAEVQELGKTEDEAVRVAKCRADISNSIDRQQLLAATREQFGRLDLLVNNAGIAPEDRVDLLEATEESFDQIMRVNLKSPYFLTQAAARWMIDQKSAGKFANYQPAIVSISSVSAYAASPERGDYCVAKAGLAMLTKLYATRLAGEGINVFEIRPGIIATDMTAAVKGKYDHLMEEALTPIRRWGTPDDVARAVAAIAAGGLSFSTGEVINVDGGFHLRRL
jgi:3-oxoacyl-[acyl-carrier protein] reductase